MNTPRVHWSLPLKQLSKGQKWAVLALTLGLFLIGSAYFALITLAKPGQLVLWVGPITQNFQEEIKDGENRLGQNWQAIPLNGEIDWAHACIQHTDVCSGGGRSGEIFLYCQNGTVVTVKSIIESNLPAEMQSNKLLVGSSRSQFLSTWPEKLIPGVRYQSLVTYSWPNGKTPYQVSGLLTLTVNSETSLKSKGAWLQKFKTVHCQVKQ